MKPVLFYASTPSYRGTHIDGFREAAYAAVSALAVPAKAGTAPRGGAASRLNLISGLVSAEDIRELHSILRSFAGSPDSRGRYPYTLFPTIPTPWTGLPGKATRSCPRKERGRLVDAYIDGHKYLKGKRALVYGEEDFVCALASFLDEIGVVPIIAATGADNPQFPSRLRPLLRNIKEEIEILGSADFAGILERAQFLKPDFVMGHSKGLYLARNLGIPLVRCGFPVHDRIGGQRILHLGYRGTLNLFDLICNSLIENEQARHERGYTYM